MFDVLGVNEVNIVEILFAVTALKGILASANNDTMMFEFLLGGGGIERKLNEYVVIAWKIHISLYRFIDNWILIGSGIVTQITNTWFFGGEPASGKDR